MSDPLLPTRSTVDIEVRYAETDQMGVVHHATYLVWFELARTTLCKLSGVPYTEIERMGYYLMLLRAELEWRQPSHYGDTVAVSAWVERLASRLTRFAYEVRREGQLLATGATEHVWVDRRSRRPCRIPETLVEPFSRIAGDACRLAGR